MSSTRRGAARVNDDFYPTPQWCTRSILRRLFDTHPRGLSFVDPCAGDGAILHAIKQWDPTAKCSGLELDDARANAARGEGFEVETRDALDPRPWPDGFVLAPRPWPSGIVLTNPPFRLALEFITRALVENGDNTIVMLLRLAWLEGLRRAAFHRAYPADVFVLPRRPSFCGRGADSSAYAWFRWEHGTGGRWEILDLESAE